LPFTMPCPPATTTVQSSTLQAEVEKRAQRMALLQAKLQRTRFTLTELQASQQRLRTSTDKVESLNAQLNKDERSKARRASLGALRGELNEALSVMNAASRRVEQMEAITDMLVSQLAEREAQLGEAQEAARCAESQHAQEVAALTGEREGLIDQVASSQERLADLEARDAELGLKLDEAARRAATLGAALRGAEAERDAAVAREREALRGAMAEAQQAQHDLVLQLQAKEEALAAALEQAKMGTPVGEGAKKVLPMAFQRIKCVHLESRAPERPGGLANVLLATQQQLAEEKAQREGAETAAQQAQRERDEAINTLESKISAMDAERQRQVAEKHASLESMVRAAAAATTEAAMKAEALKKLRIEQEALEARLAASEGHGAEVAARLAARDAEVGTLSRQSAAAVTNLERRLEESAARRAELEAALAAARAMATGEGHRADAAAAEIVALRSELAGAGGALEAARAAHARDQEEGAARCEELAARLAEVREAGRQLAELKSGAEARAAALESELEELKQAPPAGTPVGNASKQVVRLSFAKIQEMREREAEQGERVAALEASLEEARAKLAEAQAALQTRETALQAQLEGKDQELAAARTSAAAAAAALHARLDEALAGARVAQEAHAAVQAEPEAHLQSKAALQAEIESLRDTVAHLGTLFYTADATLAAQTAAQEGSETEWVAQLCAARSDRDAAELERAGLERDLQAALERLAAKEAEVEEARGAPTPKGEAAKQVASLSMRRIAELQSELAAHEAAVAAAGERSAALAAELEATRAELAAAQAAAQAESGSLAEELAALRARVAADSENAAVAKTQMETLEAALAAARLEAASLSAARAGAMGDSAPRSPNTAAVAPLQASPAAPVLLPNLLMTCLLGALSFARIAELEEQLADQMRQGEAAQEGTEQARQELASAQAARRAAAESSAEVARLEHELAVSSRQVEEQRALLTHVTEALALQREATSLTQRLGDERAVELAKQLETARRASAESGLRLQQAERELAGAARTKRQHAELSATFSAARAKAEALAVELNALKAEKALRSSSTAQATAEVERARRREQAGERRAEAEAARRIELEAALRASRVEAQRAGRAAEAAEAEAARKLQALASEHSQRERVLRLVASLACGALLALGSAWMVQQGKCE
ncbi:hypothetical protein APUTEX25_000443, partial [Auxenochlorella protothecoides]